MINALGSDTPQPRSYTNTLDAKGLTPAVTAATTLGPEPGANSAGSTGGNAPQQRLSLKKKLPIKFIVGLIVLVLFLIGGGAAYYLSLTSQDVRQQASVGTYTAVDVAGTISKPQAEQIVGNDNYLQDCLKTRSLSYCNNIIQEAQRVDKCGEAGQPACLNIPGVTNPCGDGMTVVNGRCAASSGSNNASNGKLDDAKYRQLTQSCVHGIDFAAERCLPAPGTTNGSLNLGNGSGCSFSSQCDSGICSNAGSCVATQSEAAAQGGVKPAGNASALYKPEGDILYTGYGADVTLKDPDNKNTSGTCANNYDCALGYSCGGGSCKKDSEMYTCTSSSGCPAGYSCTDGVCGANLGKTGGNLNGTCSQTTGGCPAGFSCTDAGRCQSERSNAPSDKNPGDGSFGLCKGVVCTNAPGGCIAIHMLPEKWPDGQVTVATPIVTTGSVNAQEIADKNCMYVQVDVLNGGNGSCVNGHINGDWSTLVGAVVVSPQNCTPAPTQVAVTTQQNITSSDGYTPPGDGGGGGGGTPTPTPTLTPTASPSASPTATPSATPTSSATPTPVVATATPTPNPTTTVTQTAALVGCGDVCAQTSDCSNLNHVCYQGACRLASNPTNTSCTVPQSSQPSLPQELPVSGSDTLGTVVKVGLGVLSFGALLLLFL